MVEWRRKRVFFYLSLKFNIAILTFILFGSFPTLPIVCRLWIEKEQAREKRKKRKTRRERNLLREKGSI
jgi:hypothetical protein